MSSKKLYTNLKLQYNHLWDLIDKGIISEFILLISLRHVFGLKAAHVDYRMELFWSDLWEVHK